MDVSIGQRVLLLDDDLSGTIMDIDAPYCTLETEDGFSMQVHFREIIPAPDSGIPSSPGERVVARLEEQAIKKQKPNPQKTKKGDIPPMEVDLHIHQLTSNERGMTAHDKLNLQMDAARGQLEFAIRKRIPKVVFIHGVGAGVLKMELEYLFGHYDNVEYYDANYQKYGQGATEVRIFQNAKAGKVNSEG